MMKVLVFGSINIDMVFTVDHIVRGGETIPGSSCTWSAGGKGANQAAALAKAGMDTYFAGKIGADGDFLLELLASYRVNTCYTERYEGATGQALIQLDADRQNAIVLYAGGNGRIGAEQADRVLADFSAGDTIVLQNEIPLTGYLIEKAKKQKLRVVLNPSPIDERIEMLPLEQVDIFFVNEIEGAQLARLPADAPHEAILEGIMRRFPHAEIVLTVGKAGAYYGFEDTRAQGAIVEMPLVDTTAAGDTFLGYFIAARSRGFTAASALAAACRASSLAVSRPGAMASIPEAHEVFESLV